MKIRENSLVDLHTGWTFLTGFSMPKILALDRLGKLKGYSFFSNSAGPDKKIGAGQPIAGLLSFEQTDDRLVSKEISEGNRAPPSGFSVGLHPMVDLLEQSETVLVLDGHKEDSRAGLLDENSTAWPQSGSDS